MKKNWLLIAGIALLLAAAVLMVTSSNKQSPVTATQTTAPQTPAPSHHEHSTSAAAQAVPAHFEVPPSKSLLGPTLNPDSFNGPVRDAYRAVREIPVTIAQLPCYCHCD